MKFLDHEEMIFSEGGGNLILTNFRILKIEKSFGKNYRNEFLHEDISSIQYNFQIKYQLLILAVLPLASSFLLTPQLSELKIWLWSAGAISLFLFFISRKRKLRITSKGGCKMDFQLSNATSQSLEDFIFAIQECRVKRK